MLIRAETLPSPLQLRWPPAWFSQPPQWFLNVFWTPVFPLAEGLQSRDVQDIFKLHKNVQHVTVSPAQQSIQPTKFKIKTVNTVNILKDLKRTLRKCRLLMAIKQSAGNYNPQDVNICMYTNRRYILNHLLLHICPIVYKHQFRDFTKTELKSNSDSKQVLAIII